MSLLSSPLPFYYYIYMLNKDKQTITCQKQSTTTDTRGSRNELLSHESLIILNTIIEEHGLSDVVSSLARVLGNLVRIGVIVQKNELCHVFNYEDSIWIIEDLIDFFLSLNEQGGSDGI
jgi:hypothetical protein